MLTDGSEKEPITGAFFVRACVQQKMHQPCCYMSGWTCFTWSRCVCVCIRLSDISSGSHVIPPVSPRDTSIRKSWRTCECFFARGVNVRCHFVLSCRLFVFVCCCSPVCTFKHAQTRTQTSLLSNLSCPGLLSAIHFPVSQPSIIPACPQMQPSLLKTMRGNDVYRSRRRLRQAKRERGGGGFLIKIAIDWDS